MKTFTIDTDNNISAFATPEEAAATNPSHSFASQKELEELAAAWPAERLVAIWNSLPGVTPAKKLKDPKTAAARIWERIQGLGAPEPQPEQPMKPKAERKAKGGAKVAKGAARKVTIFMRRSCNTSTTRQGAHDSALGSWASVGPLRGAGTVEGCPFLGGFAHCDNDR
jgi:hypothetical protein